MKTFQKFTSIKTGDPYAVKTKLGWFLLGGKKSRVHVQSNLISIVVEILDLETFWSIDSDKTVKKPDRILIKKDKKQAYGILKKGICFKNGHCEVRMLWKDRKALKKD